MIKNREYLYALQVAFSETIQTGGNVKIVHSGDSTTAGIGASDLPPVDAMDNLASAYKVPVENVASAHSSQSTVAWDQQHVDNDIANHSDMNCYIARWGLNDGSEHGNVTTFETALRSGLTKLRQFSGVDQLTIVLMTPNAVNDSTNNRDASWLASIEPIIAQAADDFKCVLFDTNGIFPNAVGGAGLWLDDPFGDGRGVHPSEELNALIYSELARLVFDQARAFSVTSGPITPGDTGVASVQHINGWTSLQGFQPLKISYRDGLATLTGLIHKPGGASNGSAVAVVPVGLRPSGHVQATAKTQNGSKFGTAYVTVSSGGNIVISGDGGDGVGVAFNMSWVI